MTAIADTESALTLPASVRSLLLRIILRRWWVATAVGMLQLLTLGLAVLLAGALVLGCFPNLWAPIRLLVAFAVWLIVLRSTTLVLRPAFRRTRFAVAAMEVEQRRPDLEERLSSAVELAADRDSPFRGSPALIAHLIRQVDADARSVRHEEVVRIDPIFRWTVYFMPVLLAWVVLALLPVTGTKTLAGLYRVLMPWKNDPPALSVMQPGGMTPPQIMGIEVRYVYPAYTSLPPRAETGSDGTIDALTGTRVTLTVHTSSAVVAANSRLVVSPVKAGERLLPLKQIPGANVYQAQLMISESGHYTVQLVNESGSSSKTEPQRTIIARPDEAPAITIVSPGPQITVRPDDVIPIRYQATDDFGIAHIDAMFQVDDGEIRSVPVQFNASDLRHVSGDYAFSVADIVNASGVAGASRITFHLKVTDTREPDPQFAVSERIVLQINRSQWESFQAEQDRRLVRSLEDSIRRAISTLDQNKPRVEQVKSRNPAGEPLEEWRKKGLDQAAQELPRAAGDLDKAAGAAADSVFQDVAKQVRGVAQGPMRLAAEQAARADLNPDDVRERTDAAIKSVAGMTEAREKLQKLLDSRELDRKSREAESARDLVEASRMEQEVASMIRPQEQASRDDQTRRVQQRALERQQQANQRLHQAIDQTEALRDPKSQEIAQKLQDLIRKVTELSRQQAAAPKLDRQANAGQEEQIARQAGEARQHAEDLARKAREAANSDVENRASLAQADLDRAAQQANAAAETQRDAARASDEAARQERAAGESLARAESDLRQAQAGQSDALVGPMDQAAHAAQEAAQAINEANEPNPAAARQAALALGRAARAMGDAVPGAVQKGSSAFGQGQEAQARSKGNGGQASSNEPGQSADPASGIGAAPAGAGSLPAAIRDIGISADQWAKLPPLAKKDLLNAAQQSGPPSYRQMIKDYYSRVAQMQETIR